MKKGRRNFFCLCLGRKGGKRSGSFFFWKTDGCLFRGWKEPRRISLRSRGLAPDGADVVRKTESVPLDVPVERSRGRHVGVEKLESILVDYEEDGDEVGENSTEEQKKKFVEGFVSKVKEEMTVKDEEERENETNGLQSILELNISTEQMVQKCTKSRVYSIYAHPAKYPFLVASGNFCGLKSSGIHTRGQDLVTTFDASSTPGKNSFLKKQAHISLRHDRNTTETTPKPNHNKETATDSLACGV